ncbi:MAG TPA: hypothetical protein VGD87_13580 [Archangium sp.]
MRRLLVAVAAVVSAGCAGSVNGEVAGLRLSVADSIFWYALDTSGRVNGVFLTLADRPRLCEELKANREKAQKTSLSFTLFTLTQSEVLPPQPGDYTVSDVPETPGNFAYALFSRSDAACQPTLSEPSGFGRSGLVKLERIRGEKGGNAAGTFDVTFGTGDRVTGNFNAEFCDIAVAPARPSCE